MYTHTACNAAGQEDDCRTLRCHLEDLPLPSEVVVRFTVHAFPACAYLTFLFQRADIPNNQREDNGAEYWRLHGKRLPLALRAVAQSVFGYPASAGVKRDFCIVMFMPRNRGSLDPANLEMSLFPRAQYDYTPCNVPKLSDDAAQLAILERCRDQTILDDVQVLISLDEEESNDKNEVQDADECVLTDPTSREEGRRAAAGNGGGRVSGTSDAQTSAVS